MDCKQVFSLLFICAASLNTWSHVSIFLNVKKKWNHSHNLLKCLYQTKKVSGHVFCILGSINLASFYDFDIWFWNCSDSVIIINKISSIQVSYLEVTKNFQNINHARKSSIASRIARKATTKLIMVVCIITILIFDFGIVPTV
jgi:hypothetical protein